MIKRKERILISAIELLDKGGVGNITTKNIAKSENVSEPALYRQYKNKLEIIKQIILEFASYDDKIMNTITESEIIGKEAILFYTQRYSELYENYSELTTVMCSMDLYEYHPDTKVMMKDIVNNKILFLKKLLDDNQLETPFSSEELAALIYGTIFSEVHIWRINDKSYPLGEKLINIITKLI